jgi:site-specific DNA-methyltransferase (adenine-specific)
MGVTDSNLTIYWQTSEDMSVVDQQVNSIITSPPYWDLKDYGHEDQIGTSDESYEAYLERMKSVWSECYDVLTEDGSLWIVVDTVMDRGDLRLLPQHIVDDAKDVGFRLEDMVIWYKPTAIAGMTGRNVVNKKEYIVYLSKSENHELNHEEGMNGVEDPAISEGSNRLGNIWRFPVKRGSVGQNVLHKAPYPIKLINRIVNISTDEGDVVLDPFLGSGTTAYSALSNGRKCVGFELNQDFEDVINDRLSDLNQSSLKEFNS